MAIQKIISGGQTGVDQIGLKVGRMLGIETGGTAPHGWKTENGPCYKLADYGLVQSFSSDYKIRTEDNVRDSDATIIFGDTTTPGSKCTLAAISKHKKKHLTNPSSFTLLMFFREHGIEILNVAGNRGSKLTATQRLEYGNTLMQAIKTYNKCDQFEL